ADIEVDARGLSSGEQMFRWSRGQTRVGMATILVINEFFNNDNHCTLKGVALLLHYHSRFLLESPLASISLSTFKEEGWLKILTLVEMEKKNRLIIPESPSVFPYNYAVKLMYGICKTSSLGIQKA
ncbi:hypothetical protein J1N35_018859, partial [Gossypium stocksii]